MSFRCLLFVLVCRVIGYGWRRMEYAESVEPIHQTIAEIKHRPTGAHLENDVFVNIEHRFARAIEDHAFIRIYAGIIAH